MVAPGLRPPEECCHFCFEKVNSLRQSRYELRPKRILICRLTFHGRHFANPLKLILGEALALKDWAILDRVEHYVVVGSVG